MNETKLIFGDIKEIQNLINKNYISDDLKNQLLLADIIILPIEEFREYKKPVFPNGTENIYLFLKKNLPKKYTLEIAINDEDYKEFALHHAFIELGIFMLKSVLLPFLLGLLANFVSNKLLLDSKEKIKVKIIITDYSKEIDFEGPIEDFNLIFKELKKISKK